MYSSNSANIRHKNQAEVTIRLVGEEPFDAFVFLSIGDRLIDLLNDDRHFIPARRPDGKTIIVAKSQIVSIIETAAPEMADTQTVADDVEESHDAKESPADAVAREVDDEFTRSGRKPTRRFDPYEMLRVSKDASVQEIRSAYKSRIKAVHPDSVASLGLDDELAQAALKTTQKLNYAYRKIMRDREDEPDTDERESA